jgi:hypothetical protein
MEGIEFAIYFAMFSLVVCMFARFVIGFIGVMQEYNIDCRWLLNQPDTMIVSDGENNDHIEVDVASSESSSDHDTLSMCQEEIQELVDSESFEWILVSSAVIPGKCGEWVPESILIERPYSPVYEYEHFTPNTPIFSKED